MKLAGKAALITGGGVRIGRTLALALAQAGCDILVHHGRSLRQAQETRDAARSLGVSAEACAADLADSNATRNLVSAGIDLLGRIDILINNAAIFPDTDTFNTTDTALFDQLFAVNLRAPFILSQAFASHLDHRQGGIINIVDARVRRPQTDHFAYRLTKGALWQMTEMLALELAPRATVNAIALGAVLPPPGHDESYLEKIARTQIPLRRHGSGKEVAENALHLLTQDFLTGTVIELDGGQFL